MRPACHVERKNKRERKEAVCEDPKTVLLETRAKKKVIQRPRCESQASSAEENMQSTADGVDLAVT